MKTVAIICEYNPFHNGHKYQIEQIRAEFGEQTTIICIMSGNFVQRGDFAIYPKHLRAKTAVLGGANLVIELPLPFALSSAENFATGAISVLNQINCVDYLCFGSECGKIDKLLKISEIMLGKSFNEKLKEVLKTGVSYPKAVDLSLENAEYSEIVQNPNNTLGIEYIKALLKSKSEIKPFTITRKNADHHSQEICDNICSASYIRNNITSDFSHLMPKKCHEEISKTEEISILTAENSILSYLKRKNCDFFLTIRDVNEGLENKIVKELKTATTLEELYENIKSKRYTKSRIRRIIINSYLEITREYVDFTPKYAKVLAFDDTGRKILKQNASQIPYIIKPTDDYSLCEIGQKQLELDIQSTDLYAMAFRDIKARTSSYEQKTSPIYIGK